MKRLTFIVLFVGINIFFIFLQIHKQSLLKEISYQNQKKKIELDTLLQQKDTLTHQLQALKSPGFIKEYATNNLNMKPVKLSQIKLMTAQD